MQDPGYRIDAPYLTRADSYRLFETYAELGRELIRRPTALVGGAAWRLLLGAAAGALGPWDLRRAVDAAAAEARDLAIALAGVPAAAATTAAQRLAAPERQEFRDRPDPLGDSTPQPDGMAVPLDFAMAQALRARLVAGAGADATDPAFALPRQMYPMPFIVPARVVDSSQGWASWFVPEEAARALLQDAVERSGHLLPAATEAFMPFVTGTGRSMVTLWIVDHRIGDFGTYHEIALSMTVVPRIKPRRRAEMGLGTSAGVTDPGQIFLRMIVTEACSIAPGWQVWGLAKDYWGPPDPAAPEAKRRRLAAVYEAGKVTFRIGPPRPLFTGERAFKGAYRTLPARPPAPGLELVFPRWGGGRSENSPTTVYSAAPTRDGRGRPVRAALITGGTGQGLQFGGPVQLRLPERRGDNPDCLCSGGIDCLCRVLGDLGLDRAPPAVNGWSERFGFTLGQPLPLSLPPPAA